MPSWRHQAWSRSNSSFGFGKKYEEFEFRVGDARCDNFVKSEATIIPIDLRLSLGPTFGHNEHGQYAG